MKKFIVFCGIPIVKKAVAEKTDRRIIGIKKVGKLHYVHTPPAAVAFGFYGVIGAYVKLWRIFKGHYNGIHPLFFKRKFFGYHAKKPIEHKIALHIVKVDYLRVKVHGLKRELFPVRVKLLPVNGGNFFGFANGFHQQTFAASPVGFARAGYFLVNRNNGFGERRVFIAVQQVANGGLYAMIDNKILALKELN